MPVLIGTSGWQYDDWRGRFYPEGVAKKRWLEHYVEHFRTVESNNAFYRLPKPETFEDWAKRTPEDFVMAVKASRYLTHIKRLRDPAEPVARFQKHAAGLGSKLGPVLLQLPPTLKANLDALDETLECFDKSVRVAVEFRHESWFADETKSLLQRRRAALCLADRESKPVAPQWRTTDWGYLRFHIGAATPRPCYGRSALRTWANRLADTWGPNADIYVYFNNDHRCCAVRDARLFAAEVDKAALEPTRVPGRSDVRV
jgi:uncharacterized protein YecE (DUF72 family)